MQGPMKAHARKSVLMALLAALVTTLGGCNEISGMLDAGAGKGKDEPSKASDAPTGAQSAREKLDAYYDREPRTVEQDPNDPIVSCRLSGSTQFMRKNDCVLRGGSAS